MLRAADLAGTGHPLLLRPRYWYEYHGVTPEDVSEPKPHPEPVLFALERLGVAPGEAVFVGDSPHDIASGRAAGTRTAGALWGPFPRASLEAAGPDALLGAQHDVLRLLDEA